MKGKYIGKAFGTSMEPLITGNDKIYISSTRKLSLGDIVVFYDNKKLISHRLLRFKKNLIITKGDNVFFTDTPVHPSKTLGKVIEIHSGKKIVRLNTIRGRIINNYFLYRSLSMFYGPILLYKFLGKIFIGKNFLRNILTD